MPITIYPTTLKYKNSQGTFQSATALKGDSGEAIVEQVNGAAPTITCEANHRYICNEVSALNITPSADGVCEIIFTSGNNATVLTAPSSIKWPGWFSPDALEPNATYSFKISNNLANVAIWPEEGLTGDTRVRIQKMLGIYEPPYELVNQFTLDSESGIDLSADMNNIPFNFRDVLIRIFYPANTATASAGYGRYRFYDGNNVFVYCETQKYVTQTSDCFKLIHVTRKGNMTKCIFTPRGTTGSYGPWGIKDINANSIRFDVGNIVHIANVTGDVEPAGTQIKIWAQRAY